MHTGMHARHVMRLHAHAVCAHTIAYKPTQTCSYTHTCPVPRSLIASCHFPSIASARPRVLCALAESGLMAGYVHV